MRGMQNSGRPSISLKSIKTRFNKFILMAIYMNHKLVHSGAWDILFGRGSPSRLMHYTVNLHTEASLVPFSFFSPLITPIEVR